jgi:hypothetical protein
MTHHEGDFGMARTGYAARGLAVAGAVTLVVGLAMPAMAAPNTGVRAAAQAAAVDLPEATEIEKAKALAAIGIVADGEWIILPDRSFVSRLLTDPKSAPLTEVRAAAQAALNTEGADAATLFIRSEIFVAVEKDESRIRLEQLAKQQSREAKQRALAYLELPATPELLDLPDDQFIRRIGTLVTQPWATRTQAGVNTALRGEAPQWKVFIEAGVIAAYQADVEAYIQAQHDKTEAEREALRQKDIKRRAASIVAWVPTEGELALPSDNFIRKIKERAVAGSEVDGAALGAILSPDPAVWAGFLSTGIYAADARDKQIALDKEIAANRRLALEIQTKAEKSLIRPALVAAAKAALAGTPADVALFLRAGQYEARTQSLRTTTVKNSGWWVQSAAGDAVVSHPNPVGDVPAPVADATWKVVDGLADETCVSLESAIHPGHYLRHTANRVQLLPSDGGTEFKNAATWCVEKGLTGSGVSLKAKSQPGRYLRHLGTEVWAADKSNDNRYDRSCAFNENATWLVDGANPKADTPSSLQTECQPTNVTAAADKWGNLQVVAIVNERIYHRIRYTNGSWSSWGGLDELGAVTSVAGAIDRDNAILHLTAVMGGKAYHRIRNADGSWTAWGGLSLGSGDVTSVTAAADKNGNLQVAAIAGGQVYHRIRYTNGSWSNWGGLDEPGTPTSVGASIDDAGNVLHLTAVFDGQVYHRIRNPNGSWTDWGSLALSPGGFTSVTAAADKAGNLQVAGVIKGQVYHRIRYSNRTWSPWARLDDPGTATSVGASVDDAASVLHLTATIGAQTYHRIRNTDGSWTNWGNLHTEVLG